MPTGFSWSPVGCGLPGVNSTPSKPDSPLRARAEMSDGVEAEPAAATYEPCAAIGASERTERSETSVRAFSWVIDDISETVCL